MDDAYLTSTLFGTRKTFKITHPYCHRRIVRITKCNVCNVIPKLNTIYYLYIILVCMQYAYQNCMMSSCCWVMLCTTRRVVYSSPCVDAMVSLIKISQYHVSRDMPVCPFCTKFCIHPYSKSHAKHQTHCCPWHILPWRTWIKEIPRTQSLVISILSCKPLQWHSVSFAAICGLCEKEKRCSFRVVRQSKVWIHAFLMLIYILFQILSMSYAYTYHIHLISIHTYLYLYIFGCGLLPVAVANEDL